MRVAAIDIGTNSTRLLVAEVGPGGLRSIERHVIVTGLGQGVDATGRMNDEAIDRTVATLAGYAAAMERVGVERARAVATSASRDAENRSVFLKGAFEVLGFHPEVISGEEEAALSFRGATGGIATVAPRLVIDPGGGSTEFVFGTGAPSFLQSVDIGSVRLTERLLPDRPAEPVDVLVASATVESMFADVMLPGTPGTAIGVGGTYTSLAAIALDLPEYDRLTVHGSVLDVGRLGSLIGQLSPLTIEETAAIPSLDPARARVILAGAVIAEAALRHAGVTEIVVSESDILDGIALELAG